MITKKYRGPIAWMANNSVAANILLIVFMVGGLLKLLSMKQEIFPEFQLDLITITVPFPGASPDEVEAGIILPIEETVRGIDGVKKITAKAKDNIANIIVECVLGHSADKVADDIKSAIDQVRVFPKNAEKPTIKRIISRSEVVSVILYGDVSDDILRYYAELIRDDLLDTKIITLIDLIGTKEREIAIEIPKHNLLSYNLTFQQIADRINLASIDIAGGQLKTDYQNLMLKTNGKKDFAEEYRNIVIKNTHSGEIVRLGDISSIKDDYEEVDKYSYYNDKPAIMIKIFRTGEQKPTEISSHVKSYQEKLKNILPHGIDSALWNDHSSLLSERINLLLSNAFMGLILVFIILGLFLEARLAFWVTMGIPSSFLGAFLLLPYFGVSINMLSLFAFIIVLGMVVDDAIVIGENIYSYRENNTNRLLASIKGTKEIAVPVIFSVLTTMAAFIPLFFVPGIMGKFFYEIPCIVITVLGMSLLEALFILPNHLAHAKSANLDQGLLAIIHQKQQKFSTRFMNIVSKYYRIIILRTIKYRYHVAAISLSMLIINLGIILGGQIKFSFMPNMDSEIILLHSEFASGSPVSLSKKLEKTLKTAAINALEKLGGADKATGFYSQIGSTMNPGGAIFGGDAESGGHIVDMMIHLVSSAKRNFSSEQFTQAWQKEIGDIPGLRIITFKSTNGPDTGKAVSFNLKHKDIKILENAASQFADILKNFKGLNSIEDGISSVKEQIEFELNQHANSLEVTSAGLGHDIRNSFYGTEALRIQRGRDDIKVVVRLPKHERSSIFDIDNFLHQTKFGEVPIKHIAEINKTMTYSQITREDGIRVLTVSASVNEGETNANNIITELKTNFIPQLKNIFPGLSISESGERKEQTQTIKSLLLGFIFALILIYALIAIPLKSYSQPLIIMSAIPFGIIGATLGHLLLGLNLSVVSMMGIVALAGIVVNDSLVFVHAANELSIHTKDIEQAIIEAGIKRFRPIMLTSLTTFFGLVPMIFETSLQARFLIPMAVSIGFGVMFSTLIILILVPALYVITEDIKLAIRKIF